jgi:hypothetical protein
MSMQMTVVLEVMEEEDTENSSTVSLSFTSFYGLAHITRCRYTLSSLLWHSLVLRPQLVKSCCFGCVSG